MHLLLYKNQCIYFYKNDPCHKIKVNATNQKKNIKKPKNSYTKNDSK